MTNLYESNIEAFYELLSTDSAPGSCFMVNNERSQSEIGRCKKKTLLAGRLGRFE